MALSEEKEAVVKYYKMHHRVKDAAWDAFSEAEQSQKIYDFCNDFAKDFCQSAVNSLPDGSKKDKVQGHLDNVNVVITQGA